MEKNKVYLSWKWVDDQLNNIGDRLEGIDLEFVSGIPRGGLIPSVMLSHRLDIPLVKGDIGPDTLVIDDICDSGETLDKLVKKYQTL